VASSVAGVACKPPPTSPLTPPAAAEIAGALKLQGKKSAYDNADRELKLYRLIYDRTLASTMADAQMELTSAVVRPAGAPAALDGVRLRATGTAVRFKGFLAATQNDAEAERTTALPELLAGDVLFPVPRAPDALAESESVAEAGAAFVARAHATQAPGRYTQASFVRELESRGIGRPSTYVAAWCCRSPSCCAPRPLLGRRTHRASPGT